MARSMTLSTALPRSKRTCAARHAPYAAPDGGNSIQPALPNDASARGADGAARQAPDAASQAIAYRFRSAGQSAARARLGTAAFTSQSGRAHRRLGSRSWRRAAAPPRQAANPALSPPPAAPPRQQGSNRMPAHQRADPAAAHEPTGTSLRAKMMKRVKSLFVAASIIAIIVGGVADCRQDVQFRKFARQAGGGSVYSSARGHRENRAGTRRNRRRSPKRRAVLPPIRLRHLPRRHWGRSHPRHPKTAPSHPCRRSA